MELSRFDGTLNTIILLTSSLTAALAVFSLQELNKPRRTVLYLGGHHRLRAGVPRGEGVRVGSQVRARPVPARGRAGRTAARGDPLLRPVLHDDGAARPARDHRHGASCPSCSRGSSAARSPSRGPRSWRTGSCTGTSWTSSGSSSSRCSTSSRRSPRDTQRRHISFGTSASGSRLRRPDGSSPSPRRA